MEKNKNGSLPDTVETVLNFAQAMTWNDRRPVVKLGGENEPKNGRIQDDSLRQKLSALNFQDAFGLHNLPLFAATITILPDSVVNGFAFQFSYTL